MRYDLLNGWEEEALPGLRKKLPPPFDGSVDLAQRTPDGAPPKSIDLTQFKPNELVMQTGFELTEPAKVVFVEDFKNYIPVKLYEDLPAVPLTEKEQIALDEYRKELERNKKFYDGDHVLLKGVHYNASTNEIEVQAVQVKYAFIKALADKKFPSDSKLYDEKFYQTGVIVPFRTKDHHTVVLQRNDELHLHSFVSGFIENDGGLLNGEELLDEEESLNGEESPNRKRRKPQGLIERTAHNEACEEVLNNAEGQPTVKFELCGTMGISFRATPPLVKRHLPYVEFFAPATLACNYSALENILNNNEAKDREDHTMNRYPVPLEASCRKEAEKFLRRNLQGNFLYTLGLMILANSNSVSGQDGKFYGEVPHTNRSVLSMSMFHLKIPRPAMLEQRAESLPASLDETDEETHAVVAPGLVPR